MAPSTRVVIIGAGIVGLNLADELVTRGWKDVTVVEQGPLDMPGGSTSHAPGLVFQTSSSRTMTRFAAYTAQKLLSMECFNPVGGLELATTPERVEELKRRLGWTASWGIPDARLLTPAECAELHPMLNKESVLAGLYVPSDGLALATRAVQVLIARTRKAGVRYLGSTLVTGISQADGRVTGVETPKGVVPADIVVSCAGFWGVEVGAMVGLPVPLLPLAHHYVKTGSVGYLKGLKNSPNGASLPIIRNQDQHMYYREHGDQYGIGHYGHPPIPVVAASLGVTPEKVDDKNMPSRLQFTPEDFVTGWKNTQNTFPPLRDTPIADAFNGIFSFTPDGGPVIGQSPTVDGFWVCEAIWVTHSAGAARALAEILTTGSASLDMADCELSRFEEVQLAPHYVSEVGQKNYLGMFEIIHPWAPRRGPRNLRVSPWYARQQELGAHFQDAKAWERPEYYQANAKLVDEMPLQWKPVPRDNWSNRYYSNAAAVEAWKTRTAVAMYDMTSQCRLEVSGPGAMEFLQRLTTGDMSSPPGAATYTLMLNDKGAIRADTVVVRLEKDLFHLTVNSHVDFDYLCREARMQRIDSPHKYVHVRDRTGGTCAIGLWGPLASNVISSVTKDDFSDQALPYSCVKRVNIAGIPVMAARLSWVGESGWELSTTAEHGLLLWDVLFAAGRAHGIVAAGRLAFFALRLEKGYRVYGADVTTEHDPFESGLSHLVHSGKTSFVGASALERRSRKSPVRRLRCLTFDDPSTVIMGKEPVYHRGKAIGFVTSAALGYSLGKPLAMAYLPAHVGQRETVEVEYFGRRLQATVQRDVLIDPWGKKMELTAKARGMDENAQIRANL